MNAISPLDRPIFVVGHPRSGTTLLASMLGRHPEIVSTPESLYFNIVRFQVAPVLSKGASEVLRVIEASPMRFLIIDRQLLLAAFEDLQEITEETVFRTVLECFQAADGKPRLLEKTPWHMRNIDEILDWFPDARILWIVRDGRACVSSLLKVPWATDDPVTLARQWVMNVAFAEMFAKKWPQQIFVIKYEDLVNDPRSVIHPALEFLEVESSEQIFEHDREVRTVKPSETEWKENVGRPLMANRASAWGTELDPKVIDKLNITMSVPLRKYGYISADEDRGARLSKAYEWIRSQLVHNPLGLYLMRYAKDKSLRLAARKKLRAES